MYTLSLEKCRAYLGNCGNCGNCGNSATFSRRVSALDCRHNQSHVVTVVSEVVTSDSSHHHILLSTCSICSSSISVNHFYRDRLLLEFIHKGGYNEHSKN